MSEVIWALELDAYDPGGPTNLVQYDDIENDWSSGNTPVVTPDQADPEGGTGAFLIADDSGSVAENKYTVVTFTTSAAKDLMIWVKEGTMPGSGVQRIQLYDNDAAAVRAQCDITGWAGGKPTIDEDPGSLIGLRKWGDGWIIHYRSDAVVHTNENRLYITPAATGSQTGSIYVYRPTVFDSTEDAEIFASRYPCAATAVAGVRSLRYATRAFMTGPSDDTPNAFFDERFLASDLQLPVRSIATEGSTLGRTVAGEGEVALANGDGALDDLVGYGFDGRPARVYRGHEGDAFPGSWSEMMFVSEQPEDGIEKIRILLREKGAELEATIQDTLYAGDNDLPDGLEGTTELAGKPKPILLGGPVLNIPGVLVNSSKLIYQISDGQIASVDGVYDAGVPLHLDVGNMAPCTDPYTGDAYAVAYGNGYFVAGGPVSPNHVLTNSPDGITFTSRDTSTFTAIIRGGMYGLGLFVFFGESGQLASSDDNGATWTARTSGFGSEIITCGVFTGERFIVVGATGGSAYSTNGTSWSFVASGATSLAHIAHGAGIILAAGMTSTDLYYTQDGTSWNALTSPSAYGARGLAFGGGLFVLTTANSEVFTSPDGVNWTQQYNPLAATSDDIFGLAHVPSYGFVGLNGNNVIYSRDGVDWMVLKSTALTGISLSRTAASPSRIVMTGHPGTAALKYTVGVGSYASEADLLDDTLAPEHGSAKAYLAGGYVRIGSQPFGEVTFDATQGAAEANRTHAQLWAAVLQRAGKSSGDWSASDVTAADSSNSDVAGLWLPPEPAGIVSVLDMIARSCGAWWGVDLSGVYRFGILVAPTGTADFSFSKADVKGFRRSRQGGKEALPPYETLVRHSRRYLVQSGGLAGVVSAARRGLLGSAWSESKSTDSAVAEKHLLARQLRVDSLFTNATDGAAEASRVQTLRGAGRERYEFMVELDAANAAIELGDIVQLTYDRLGMDAGRKFVLISSEFYPGRNLMNLIVWG